MAIPSIKTIERCGVDRATAIKVRKVLDGRLAPQDASEACRAWVRACYHEPSLTEQALCAVDDLLGNHGIEALGEGRTMRAPQYAYSNTGDSYALTVVRDYENGRWLVASWGGLVESGKVREV